MRPICTIPFVGIIILAGLSFSIIGNKPINKEPMKEPGFAIVELFTSEGCSSCPPADELAIALSKEYMGNVYFLGYHVDYWDYIGWKDKFSKAEYSTLQRQYATTFNLSSIYTPQVVVNGKSQFVGSDQNRLRKAIMDELKINRTAEIELTAKQNENDISVSYKTSASDKSILRIALVQLHAETSVKRGENNGRSLKHINVVRDIQSIAINKKGDGGTDFKIPAGLGVSDIKLIAFIQDKSDLKIVAATEASVQ